MMPFYQPFKYQCILHMKFEKKIKMIIKEMAFIIIFYAPATVDLQQPCIIRRDIFKTKKYIQSKTWSVCGGKLKIKKSKALKYLKFIMTGIVTGAANGLFGSGGGTIAVPAMIFLLDAEEHKAHATAISIILPLTFASAFYYISNNYVDWGLTLKVMLGGIVGGYIGAGLLKICPGNLLRKIFAAFMILAAFRMIL